VKVKNNKTNVVKVLINSFVVLVGKNLTNWNKSLILFCTKFTDWPKGGIQCIILAQKEEEEICIFSMNNIIFLGKSKNIHILE
jgi:hypothetical protein